MKDFKKLREQAVRQEFRQTPMLCEGDYFMSAITGVKRKVHRTGVNYCIIVTEGGNMFREWVKDVRPINKP